MSPRSGPPSAMPATDRGGTVIRRGGATTAEEMPPTDSQRPSEPQGDSNVGTAKDFAAQHGNAVELGVPSLVWGPGQERRLHLIQERIPLGGRRVLDVGCGLGAYVRRLQELPADAYGVDVDAVRVREGGRTVPGLLVADGGELPFAEATFDVVILNEVIEHVRDERQTMRDVARIVGPGGHVAIYAPNRGFPFETHGVEWRGRYRFGNYPLVNYLPGRLRDRLVPHARVYTTASLLGLLAGLPYRVLHRSRVYPGFDGIRGRHERVGGFLQATLHRAERTPLAALGLSHFLILERVAGELPTDGEAPS